MFEQMDLSDLTGLKSLAFRVTGRFQNLRNIPDSLEELKITLVKTWPPHAAPMFSPALESLPNLKSLDLNEHVPADVIEGFARRDSSKPCTLRRLYLSTVILGVDEQTLRQALAQCKDVEDFGIKALEIGDAIGEWLPGQSQCFGGASLACCLSTMNHY